MNPRIVNAFNNFPILPVCFSNISAKEAGDWSNHLGKEYVKPESFYIIYYIYYIPRYIYNDPRDSEKG